MSFLWRVLLFFAGEFLKGQVVRRAKRKGVIAYIHTLQGTRYALIVALIAFFVLNAIVLAGFGALITGVWLLDLDTRAKLVILCATFSALFFIPVIALAIGFSERLWYRVSGAKKMVEELRQDGDWNSEKAA